MIEPEDLNDENLLEVAPDVCRAVLLREGWYCWSGTGVWTHPDLGYGSHTLEHAWFLHLRRQRGIAWG